MADSADIAFAARLTVHEFLFEVMYANLANNAPDPLAYWDSFGSDLVERVQNRMYVPEGASVQGHDDLAVQTEAARVMRNFVEKTRNRVADIQRQKSRPGGHQR